MPIYEYRCQACGEVTSVLQKISDPPPEACDACQGGPLNKLISKTSFILKGSGWYVTDFRDSNKKDSQKKETHGSDIPTKEQSPKTEGSSSEKASGAKKQASPSSAAGEN